MATTGIRSESPLVVIVGPTASGKTSLAVELAREFGGEIISADSRAVYRYLSIGTAKPSIKEQGGVPHWGIDLVDPGERFTVADFQHYAKTKIAEIRARGRIPFLVGGTGLYIDAVVYDFVFPGEGNDLQRREELETLELGVLHKYCIDNNVKLPENAQNKRHVVSAILRNGVSLQRKRDLDGNTLVVGIATEKQKLNKQIIARAETIFTQNVVDEAALAAERFGWDSEAMTGNIYPLLRRYLAGEITKEQLIERFIIADRQLAKRQLTWFRRNPDIVWLPLDEVYKYVAQELGSLSKS
ncbi:MAG: tRNA (adenosine(37)-N6)-dimethylallyltransferase MiaA [Candidatus Saccharimonas sp.]